MRPVLLCMLLVCGSTIPASAQQLKEITNSIGMELVLIHRGSFTMGASAEEKPLPTKSRLGLNVVPNAPVDTRQEVMISNSFYLGKFELTQGEFEKVMGKNPSKFKDTNNPVESVSWEDAVLFCNKLSELPPESKAGRTYRLPTEAEWEYACRATSTTVYSFGANVSDFEDYGWARENSGGTTNSVGRKKANRWGIFDMNGNVWEWCHDLYDSHPLGQELDPQGTSWTAYRGIRGGSWDRDKSLFKSAARRSMDPLRNSDEVGFRVALSMPSKQPAPASNK